MEDEEDERREAALSSIPSLHSNFTRPGITSDQLSKFQELHKRRLQIKTKAKNKFTDNTCRTLAKQSNDKEHSNKSSSSAIKESNLCTSLETNITTKSQQDERIENFATQKRRKLHWGLDTKERWERKANM